jgi:two-component system OmpR family sensor kinase
MKWWGWVLALLPAGAGILIGTLAAYGIIPNPVLYLRGQLSALAIAAGVTISIITIGIALLWVRKRTRLEREMQEVQARAVEDRRRFLQRLDHELKNPLTAIQAGLINLANEPLEPYPAGEVVAVQDQVRRISRLVADLRKLAALETAPLEVTIVNVAELLSDVVGAMEAGYDLADRRLELILPNAPWPLPEIEGDPDLLLLAIHNLLDNAAKFTSPDDTIEVRASDDGGDVVIEVADTGPGIPEQDIERVWEELYRGEQARGVPGSGLGLPLARAIIQRHGGIVSLRSKPGQGTLFSVRLPGN